MSAYRQILIAMTLCLLALGLMIISQLPDMARIYGEKSGRVVDGDSGEGVPSAIVIAHAFYDHPSLMRIEHDCAYIAMTTTDQNGFYHFPNEYSRHRFGPPFEHRSHYFSVMPSKDGFVNADIDWPLQIGPDGSITSRIKSWSSLDQTPQLDGLTVQLPILYLMRVDLSLDEKIAYFAQTGLADDCAPYDPTLDRRKQIQHDFYHTVTNQVCTASVSDDMGQMTLGQLAFYAPRWQEFLSAMIKVDPKWAGHAIDNSIRFRFGQICDVLKAGDVP